MAQGVTIKIDNTRIKEVVDRLRQLEGVGTVKTLARVMRRSMKKTTELARTYAPVRTGALRNSIRVAVRKPKKGNIVVEVGTVVRRALIESELTDIGNDDTKWKIRFDSNGVVKSVKKVQDARWYWHWVEFGSVNNTPKKYLRRAWDQTSPNYIPEIRAGLGEEVQKILSKRGGSP